MEAVRNFAGRMADWGERLGVLGIMVMVLASVADVLGAKLFELPLTGAIDVVSMGQLAAIVLAVAITQRHKGHISVEMFVLKMPPRLRATVKLFTSCLGVLLFVVIIWEAVHLGGRYLNVGEITPTAHIPMYPFAYIFAVAMVPVALMLICDAVDAIKELG